MGDVFNPKWGQVVALGPFTAADVTTQAANQDLAGPQGATVIAMPYDGSVVGISISSAVAQIGTATGITAKAHKASTELANTPAPLLSSDNTLGSYATKNPGTVKFSAGDKLGISVSGATDMTPTNTVHVEAWLFVVFNPY